MLQQKLEFLFQIDMTLSLEAVNVKHLIQECQVCHVRFRKCIFNVFRRYVFYLMYHMSMFCFWYASILFFLLFGSSVSLQALYWLSLCRMIFYSITNWIICHNCVELAQELNRHRKSIFYDVILESQVNQDQSTY